MDPPANELPKNSHDSCDMVLITWISPLSRAPNSVRGNNKCSLPFYSLRFGFSLQVDISQEVASDGLLLNVDTFGKLHPLKYCQQWLKNFNATSSQNYQYCKQFLFWGKHTKYLDLLPYQCEFGLNKPIIDLYCSDWFELSHGKIIFIMYRNF